MRQPLLYIDRFKTKLLYGFEKACRFDCLGFAVLCIALVFVRDKAMQLC